MSITKRTTAHSVIYEFDGYSEAYRAFVQGAFVGTFIVPKQHAHLIREGEELDCLKEMRESRRFGVVLRDARTIA